MPDFALLGNKNLPPLSAKKQGGNNKPVVQNNTIELPMNKVKNSIKNAKTPKTPKTQKMPYHKIL